MLTARPTFIVEGQDSAALTSELLRLVITEDVNAVHRCEATFGNWGSTEHGLGFLYFDRTLLDFGKTLTVRVDDQTIFEGRVVSLTGGFSAAGPPTVTAVADDRLVDFRVTRRTRTFSNASVSDILHQISADHGLSAVIDVAGPTSEQMSQVDQSDLTFIRELCRNAGVEVYVSGNVLHAQHRENRNGGMVDLSYGRELLELSVCADLSEQYTSVAVSGWDAGAKRAISVEADQSTVAAETHGERGAAIVLASFGERRRVITDSGSTREGEAAAVAGAAFTAMARRFVTTRGVAQFNARLRVGCHAKLTGVGRLFDGEHYISHVRHRFDNGDSLRTEFVAERAWLGRPH